MKKLLTVLLVLMIAGSLFAGGNRDSGAATGGSSDSGLQAPAAAVAASGGINVGSSGNIAIGIAMPETHVLRWIKDGNALLANAEARGYAAGHQNAIADQALQNMQIQNFLTRGARALVVGTINDGALPVIEEARRDGVKVLAYDRIIQGTTNYDGFITFDNYRVGTLQGQAIVEGANLAAATSANPKYITLFAGSPTDANANFFFQGAMDVLLPYIDSGALRVVGPFPRHYSEPAFQQIATEGWNPAIAKARMENLLNSSDFRNVTLDAVLTPNDTLGLAVIEACKTDAKYRTKLPIVTGQDAQIDGLVSIQNGELYATVFKDTNKLAEAAILIIDQLLKGQPVNVPGIAMADGALREIGNTGTGYVPTYLFTPVPVTRANLFDPVDAGFITPEEARQLRR